MLTAVVGAGGVGGLLAALLHRAGADVVLVVTSRSRQLLAEGGLRVDSDLFGRWVSRPPLSLQVPSGAAVLLAVKAPHLAQVVPGVVAAGPSQVVTLQNGIEHVARLRGAMPHTPITPAAIYVETRRIDDPVRLPPVTIEHRSPFLRLHLPAGDEHGFAGPLRAAGAEVRYAGAEDAVLWDKFALLAPMALLTAYHRAPLGAALARDPELTGRLLREIHEIAVAAGQDVTVEDVERRLAALPVSMRSSLQHDLAAGRDSELDALAGALERLGDRLGVPTPTLTAFREYLDG